MKKTKILVVVGPTASGKTRFAVELAKRYNGEVVSADSMQIYQGMTIATAKPTEDEMQGIPHHLIDILDPSEPFSVSQYVQLAHDAIAKVSARGKLPIVAGGTGLYIDSLVENITFSEEPRDDKLRQSLYEEAEADAGRSLYERLCRIDPQAAAQIHPNNLVRVVRAVEVYQLTGKTLTQLKLESRHKPSPYDPLVFGLNYRSRAVLYERIDRRVDLMVEAGLVEEARNVLGSRDLKTARNAIGYKELEPYFLGKMDLESCLAKVRQESRRYAKRQLTWFKRNESVVWIYPDDFERFDNIMEISYKYIESFLSI